MAVSSIASTTTEWLDALRVSAPGAVPNLTRPRWPLPGGFGPLLLLPSRRREFCHFEGTLPPVYPD